MEIYPTTAIIIDNDEKIVKVFSELLGTQGIDVLGVGRDGKEAVEVFQKNKPEIVFLDVMMPDYDGFYALSHIREIDEKVLVLMVTADLSENTEVLSEKLGANGIVYKPFELEKLVNVLKSIPENKFLIQNR